MYNRYQKKKVGERKRAKTDLDKEHEKTRRLCSEYIRKRDVNAKGYGYCRTCFMAYLLKQKPLPKAIHRKEADAGHFVSVSYGMTKYRPSNINIQCRGCNRAEYGEQHLHGLYINHIYGEGTAEKIQIDKNDPKSWTVEELKELQEWFKAEIKKIHDTHGRDKRRTVTNKKQVDPNLLFANM